MYSSVPPSRNSRTLERSLLGVAYQGKQWYLTFSTSWFVHGQLLTRHFSSPLKALSTVHSWPSTQAIQQVYRNGLSLANRRRSQAMVRQKLSSGRVQLWIVHVLCRFSSSYIPTLPQLFQQRRLGFRRTTARPQRQRRRKQGKANKANGRKIPCLGMPVAWFPSFDRRTLR